MALLGWIHFGTALAAIVLGAVVVLMRKGTTRHRQVGWMYVASMLVLNVSALLIYRLFGWFGPFHAAAVVSLVGVVLGTAAGVRTRRHRVARRLSERAGAVEGHYMWMAWSYVGLLAAAVSEAATRLPIFRFGSGRGLMFGLAVVAATFVVVTIGARTIRTRKSILLAPYALPAKTPRE